eukprot:TRINITY_DN4349_c0_g1_i16.p1 TRINITY_DN4349_c0_g1~~TRINITY_DN4349_c0_g1_i16.p1  ORF type:complete len:796 (-),score=166.50 TRINITY_DN4349_c0_g1_i16:451-2838(-)
MDVCVLPLPYFSTQLEHVIIPSTTRQGVPVQVAFHLIGHTTRGDDTSNAQNSRALLASMLLKSALRTMGHKHLGRAHFRTDRAIHLSGYVRTTITNDFNFGSIGVDRKIQIGPVLLCSASHALSRFELWPGYSMHVIRGSGNMAVVTDITHKVLRTETVLDTLRRIREQCRDKNTARQMSQRALLGQVVVTRYNNRAYHIDKIDWQMSPLNTFQRNDGTTMTFQQYYATMYNRTITNLTQPLLVHYHKRDKNAARRSHQGGGGKEAIREASPIYLIPELTHLTGISDSMRKDGAVMKAISTQTRISPESRKNILEFFIKEVATHPETQGQFSSWGVDVHDRVHEVTGSLLSPEEVQFQKNAIRSNSLTAEWGSSSRNHALMRSVPLRVWQVLFCKDHEEQALSFVHNMQKVGRLIKLVISPPQLVPLTNDDAGTYMAAIAKNIREDLQCIVCILPNAKRDRYDAIKRMHSRELHVPSQCVLLKSLTDQRTVMSVCHKIALQITCKLGGELWRVKLNVAGTMVVGIDICQNVPKPTQSVAGFCASTNQHCTQYYSTVVFQEANQDKIAAIGTCITAALERFKHSNGHLPEAVIVYRDGLSDSAANVERDEIHLLYQAFGMVYEPTTTPRLTYITVKKRVHTRIFHTKSSSTSSASVPSPAYPSPSSLASPLLPSPSSPFPVPSLSSPAPSPVSICNPAPGTVVSSHDAPFNFFLVSQSTQQGTIMPGHYLVVHDTSGMSPLHIQQFTYKMCHLYYNWPGTIRVPAPCQYAQKAAFLAGQSIHSQPTHTLADKLYFL